jgi:hypothetical protein
LAGNALASNFTWSFTTDQNPDQTPPVVLSTVPVSNGYATNPSYITATFSEAMDPATISTATFQVIGVTGTVEYSGTTAKFTPLTPFAGGTYFVQISTGAKDLAGNSLPTIKSWTIFARATLSTITVTPVNLYLNEDYSTYGVAKQLTATATYADNMTEVITNRATWTSLDVSKATVSAGGAVTAAGYGLVDIKASLDGVSGQVTVHSCTFSVFGSSCP